MYRVRLLPYMPRSWLLLAAAAVYYCLFSSLCTAMLLAVMPLQTSDFRQQQRPSYVAVVTTTAATTKQQYSSTAALPLPLSLPLLLPLFFFLGVKMGIALCFNTNTVHLYRGLRYRFEFIRSWVSRGHFVFVSRASSSMQYLKQKRHFVFLEIQYLYMFGFSGLLTETDIPPVRIIIGRVPYEPFLRALIVGMKSIRYG